ncbi:MULTISPECIES: DUF116 domain-containing protein [Clostridium]|uniref:DUF116 domain-containing protein n=1 Tax=Clostridium TaxID=1485 RepID=UPI000826ED6C|nr:MULTISPECIES: DUF116 domain-containing protein [Clostridium]PJI06739.1 DUF116 domain-containing protein [Clostridium sp. CT7]
MEKVITYSLKNGNTNSNDYYKDVSVLTDEILLNGKVLCKSILEDFDDYVKLNCAGEKRSENEYFMELLILGVMWQLYSDDAIDLSEMPRKLLFNLKELRQNNISIKPCVDFIRGILSTIFLYPNDNYNLDAKFTLKNFEKLIGWMSASGEFNEEVTRFDIWNKYLHSINFEAVNNFFSSVITLELYFSVRCESILGKYTKNVNVFLKSDYQKHKWREDVIFCGRQPVEYHLNMVGAEIMNRVYRDEFLRAPHKKLILSGCMRYNSDEKCRAVETLQGKRCKMCSRECTVNNLTRLGGKHGFEVFIVEHESSAFKKTNIQYGEVGIVGVACVLNLLSGGFKARRLNMVPQCVILDYCGCKNHWDDKGIVTNINIDKLKETFKIQ